MLCAASGFGRFSEAKGAAELADFAGQLTYARNESWRPVRPVRGSLVVGTITIGGEELGPGAAHLRWFIVDDGHRDIGIGRAVLAAAVAFCDRLGFAETNLWTFQCLDAA